VTRPRIAYEQEPSIVTSHVSRVATHLALIGCTVFCGGMLLPEVGSAGIADSSTTSDASTGPASGSVVDRAGSLASNKESPLPQRETVLEEVIVTARRRPENIQSVPIAITSFSANDLRSDNITTMQDLAMLTPSLFINNSVGLGSAFVLRGQGTILGAPPGVIAYFAEVPVIDSQTALGTAQGGLSTGQFFDITSVDVLKGPQGTLFGRNTTGGAIMITPQQPTERLGGYAQLTFGAYNWREFEGAVNVPLANNQLLVRLAGNISSRDGYTIDEGPFFPGRDYDDRRYQAARFSAIWQPNGPFENDFIASIYNRDQNGPGGVLTYIAPNSLATAAFPTIENYLVEQNSRGPRYTSLSTLQIDREFTYGVFDTARVKLTDDLELKDILSYQEDRNTLGIIDDDFSPYALQDVSIPKRWGGTGERYSEELQLRRQTGLDRLEWIVGAYYDSERPTDLPEYEVTQVAQVGPSQYSPAVITAQGEIRQSSRAVYGESTYGLASLAPWLAHFKLTGGFRYTWDQATASSNVYLPTFGNACAFVAGSAPACEVSSSGTWSAPTWTVAIEDQWTPDLLAYVTTRRGYKSGGFNLITPLYAQQRTYGPEYVTDVEVGVKADWNLAGHSGRSDIDVFYSSYTDIQRTIPVTFNDISAPLTENVAGATITGIEIQQTLSLTQHSEASINYSYLESKYHRFYSPIDGDLTDMPFPYTPRNKLSVAYVFHLPIPISLGNVAARATYSYQSTVQGNLGGGPNDEIAQYGLLNLRMSWDHIFEEPLEVALFATNATNKVYVTRISETYLSYGVSGVNYGEPRIIGAQIRYAF
jgi:iron complex outermembrane recepter protein